LIHQKLSKSGKRSSRRIRGRKRMAFAMIAAACGLSSGALASVIKQTVTATARHEPILPHLSSLKIADPIRIIAFGSSSTEGIGASSPLAAYPAQLEAMLQGHAGKHSVEVLNRGIGGEDVDDMLRRIKADILDKKPDLVIWQTGSNDPIRNVPIDRFERSTREGIAAIRAAGADVMLMEPQWCPRLEHEQSAEQFRTVIGRIGAELDVPVIHRYDLMRAWVDKGFVVLDQLVGPDGLHMTDEGYALLARAVADQVLAESSLEKTITPLLATK